MQTIFKFQSPITMKGPVYQKLAIYAAISRMAYVLKHNTIEVSEAVSIPIFKLLDSHGAVLFRPAAFLVSMVRSTGLAASDANRNWSVVIVLRRRFDPLARDSNATKTSNILARVERVIYTLKTCRGLTGVQVVMANFYKAERASFFIFIL
jgi:hypothetical protein